MTVYFTEDFSGGTLNGALTNTNTHFDLITGTAPTFVADTFAGSGLAMHVVVGGSAALADARGQFGSLVAPIFLNYRIKATTAWPTAAWFPHVIRNGTTVRADTRWPSGVITLRNGTTAVYTAGSALPAGVWLTVEHVLDVSASKQQITVWDSSGTIVLASGLQTFNTGTANNVVIGSCASVANVDVVIGKVQAGDSTFGPFVPISNVTGTGSATLGALTGAAAGTPTVFGSASASLGGLTGSATGTPTVSGAAAATLGALTGSATGHRLRSGTAAASLGSLTGSASGRVTVTGTAAATLGRLVGSASSSRVVSGTGAATLGALTGTATGHRIRTGAGSATLGRLTGAATGAVKVSGVASATLGGSSGHATSQRLTFATATAPLGVLVGVASGSRAVVGSGSAALGLLVGSGIGHTQTVHRPDTGTTDRPDAGTITRPDGGFVTRPDDGAVTRPDLGLVTRP